MNILAFESSCDETAAAVVRDALLKEGRAGRLVLQVHVELIVECPDEEVEQVKALLEREMTGVAQLRVPLIAEANAGQSWGEAKG